MRGRSIILGEKVTPPTWSYNLPSLPGSLSAMPDAPISPTTINVSSTQVISTPVSDRIFNVIGNVGSVVQLVAGGSLTRCEIRCNGLATYAGVQSTVGGLCSHVKVIGRTSGSGTPDYGFIGCSFGDNCYATRCLIGYYITGNNIGLPAGKTLVAYDNKNFGFLLLNLYNSTFSGLMYADYNGATGGIGSATGWEIWQNVNDCDFAFVYSTRHAGYQAAIAAANEVPANTKRVRIRAVYGDGADAVGDSDPGMTITGGCQDITIDQMVMKNCSMGVTVGEYDYVTQIRRQSNINFGTCDISDQPYCGFRCEHTDGVQVDHLRLTNCGSVDPTNICKAALSVGRSPAHYISPESYVDTHCTEVKFPDVNILRGAGTWVPWYSVHVSALSRPKASGGIVGVAGGDTFTVQKIQNLAGAAFPVSVA